MLLSLGSQAGLDSINCAPKLYDHRVWVEFLSISILVEGFSPSTPVSSLMKIAPCWQGLTE